MQLEDELFCWPLIRPMIGEELLAAAVLMLNRLLHQIQLQQTEDQSSMEKWNKTTEKCPWKIECFLEDLFLGSQWSIILWLYLVIC